MQAIPFHAMACLHLRSNLPDIIPLTARGACGNLFGLSNAHFLLLPRVLPALWESLSSLVVVPICVCVCVYLCMCLSPAQSIWRRWGNSCRIYALVRRLRLSPQPSPPTLPIATPPQQPPSHHHPLTWPPSRRRHRHHRPRQLPLNFFYWYFMY